MHTILVLTLALSPAFAAASEPTPATLTPHENELLNELTKTLEARVHEAERNQDGAATILERTIASEAPERPGH